MVIGDHVTYADVFAVLEKLAPSLGRRIIPTVYSVQEFSKRARSENTFVTRVLEQPKLWVIGFDDDLPLAA